MKKIIPLIIIALFSINSFAQINDTDAKTLLETIVNKNLAFTNIRVDFSYAIDVPNNDNDPVFYGNIIVQGDKYKMNMNGQIIVCDGLNSWTYIPEEKEIMIQNAEDMTINPKNYLITYQSNFNPKLIRKYEEAGVNIQVLDLVPFSNQQLMNEAYYKIRLLINLDENQIFLATVYEKSGTEYIYSVVTFMPDVDVSESDFSFDVNNYPDCVVTDMR